MSLISYMLVIYAFFADIFVFDEHFTWIELVAAACILIVTIATSIVKLHQSNQTKENECDSVGEFLNVDDIPQQTELNHEQSRA